MTDKEKLEKIRSEVIWYIHLRNEGLIIGSCGDFEKLLKFIDSMQEEPDLNWKDMSLQEKKDLVAKLSEDIRKEEPTTSVWHDASEIPKFRKEFLAIVYTPTDVLKYVKTIYSEDEYCLTENDKWAYIDDILKL